MPSLTEENYLKEIYKLSEQQPGGVSTTAIAGALGIRAATVSDMLRRLAGKKLIRHAKYHGVSMTEKGRRLALEIIRKHRLWEVFLVSQLRFRWDEVHPIAEQLEHIRSEAWPDTMRPSCNTWRKTPLAWATACR
jgi:DtxR family Mn-dependent transcriptional regulator